MKTWTSKQIKQLRDNMELTQEAFAKMIGVTRTYVNLMERGVKTPGKTMCILLECIEKKMKKERGESVKTKDRAKNKRDL